MKINIAINTGFKVRSDLTLTITASCCAAEEGPAAILPSGHFPRESPKDPMTGRIITRGWHIVKRAGDCKTRISATPLNR
jgi:hypothetical protein